MAIADFFSFELSLRGTRVVVDSGVSTYETGPMREYCRSTRAHNTVEIEGQDLVELWGAFRVGRRCRPREVEWKELEDGLSFRGGTTAIDICRGDRLMRGPFAGEGTAG